MSLQPRRPVDSDGSFPNVLLYDGEFWYSSQCFNFGKDLRALPCSRYNDSDCKFGKIPSLVFLSLYEASAEGKPLKWLFTSEARRRWSLLISWTVSKITTRQQNSDKKLIVNTARTRKPRRDRFIMIRFQRFLRQGNVLQVFLSRLNNPFLSLWKRRHSQNCLSFISVKCLGFRRCVI